MKRWYWRRRPLATHRRLRRALPAYERHRLVCLMAASLSCIVGVQAPARQFDLQEPRPSEGQPAPIGRRARNDGRMDLQNVEQQVHMAR